MAAGKAGASWFETPREATRLLTMRDGYRRRAFFTCSAVTAGALLPNVLRM
jgi:hypothetical protein